MLRSIYKVCILVAVVLNLIACSPHAPELPEQLKDADFVDQGEFKPLVISSLPINDSIGNQTSESDLFHAYTLDLNKEDKIAFKMEGLEFGVFAVFGPQQESGKWGEAKIKEIIQWDPESNLYSMKIDFIAPQNGTYLAVIGSPWKTDYKYSLGLACLSGNCIEKGFCVHFEGTDMFGKPENSYYAVNVNSFEEGQAYLTERGNFSKGGIDKSACENLNTLCSELEEPVCAQIKGAIEKTYSNICLFKADVLKQIGNTGEASGGSWKPGKC